MKTLWYWDNILATMLSTLSKIEIIILANFDLSAVNAFILDHVKILKLRKELKCVQSCNMLIMILVQYLL